MKKEKIDKRYMSPKRKYMLTAQRKREGGTEGRITREYNKKHSKEKEPFPDVMIAEMIIVGFGTRFKMKYIVDENERTVIKEKLEIGRDDNWERWEK